MPKEKRTPFPEGYTNWNYNWHQVYNQLAGEVLSWEYMFPGDSRLTYDSVPAYNDPGFEAIEDLSDRRMSPCLLMPQREFKVNCRKPGSFNAMNAPEYREAEEKNVNKLRKVVGDYSAALDEKQLAMAATNPEGASFLRFVREKASFALRNFGSEAMSDFVFLQISSQEGTIHVPNGTEKSPENKNFTYIMDEMSDLPFLPVFENAARMVNVACDHANASRAGTLTAAQDRLARKLLLTQYDHLSAQILDSIEATDPKHTEDYARWGKVMDNNPDHVGGYERGPHRVPYDLEGRRIALRQGWPIQDAALIGALFVIKSNIYYPKSLSAKYTEKTKQSLDQLIAEISTTRITDSTSRSQMLNRIESYVKQNYKDLHIDPDGMSVTFDTRKAEKIQNCQYLSAAELDEAAREYERRKALPRQAGSDGSPVGYYEQILAGTEVLSRLSDLAQRIAPVNQGRKDLPEYDFMRKGVTNLVGMISAFYGSNVPAGKQRQIDLAQIENAHAALSDLAQSYLNAAEKSKKEPAFKKAAAEELRYYCAQIAKTAAATEIGLEAAENRRAKLDWRIEKEKAKSAAAQIEEPKVEAPKTEEPKTEEQKVEEPKTEEPKTEEPKVEEPKTEEPKAEEQKTEEQKTEEQKVEEPKVEEPKTEEQKTEEQKVEEPKVEEPTSPAMERYDVSTQKPEEKPAEQPVEAEAEDRSAYQEYLTEIISAANEIANTPLPSPLDYQGTNRQEYEHFKIKTKVPHFASSISGCGITAPQVIALYQKSLPPKEAAEKSFDFADRTLGTCGRLISDKGVHGAVLRRSPSNDAKIGWAEMTPEAQHEAIKERIDAMLNASMRVFDEGVFNHMADLERKIRICRRYVPDGKVAELQKKREQEKAKQADPAQARQEAQARQAELENAFQADLAEIRKLIQANNITAEDVTKDGTLGWKYMTDAQKQRYADESLREMLQGNYFELDIYDQYATPAQKQAILEKFLTEEEISRVRAKCLDETITPENRLKIYSNLPDVLRPDQLHTVVDSLNKDPVIQDHIELTELKPETAREIDVCRQKILKEVQDPQRQAALLKALDGADTIMSVATSSAKQATEAAEHIGCDTNNRYRYAVCNELRLEQPGVQIDRAGPPLPISHYAVLPNATNESTEKILQKPELPGKMRETLIRMLQKMSDMQMLPENPPEYREEEGNKMYGYRTIKAAKIDYMNAVRKGDLDALERARAAYDQEYRNMDELIQIAKEGFGSEYTSAPDMYVTRDPETFAFDQLNSVHQGQINSVYLLYMQMHKYKMTPEELVNDFPKSLMRGFQKEVSARCDQELAGKDFAGVLETLMEAENYDEIAGHVDYRPPVRSLPIFWTCVEQEGFDRAGMAGWANDASAMLHDIQGREILRLEVLNGQAEDKRPAKRQTIQNLITVAEADQDYRQMVGIGTYDGDLQFHPFSLDKYIQSHSIDADGMKRRLDTFINVASKVSNGPEKGELMAEAVVSCTRVLLLKQDERGTDAYKAVETMARDLMNSMSLTASGMGQADRYRECRSRANDALGRYEAFSRFTQELEQAGVAPEQNGPFDAIRLSVEKLNELTCSMLCPQPDGSLPKLDTQQREELKTAYQLVINVANAFSADADLEPNPALDKAREAAEKIRSLAAEDLETLTGVRGKYADDLGQIYSKRSLTVDVASLQTENLGTPEHVRNTLALTTPDGRTVDGVFTPDRPLPQPKDELEQLRKRIGALSENAAVALEVFEEDPEVNRELMSLDENGVRAMLAKAQSESYNNWTYNHHYDRYLDRIGSTRKIRNFDINDLVNDEFTEAVDSYLLSKAEIDGRNKLCKKMGIRPGEPLESRAAAMTAVAEALGVGSLVAATRPVTVTQNGKSRTGYFTENGKGTDCRNIPDYDPLLNSARASMIPKKAVRDMAALQVLDFICGTANRNKDNLRFETADKSNTAMLLGIQAVDNGMCFMGCPMSTDLGGNRKLSDLKTIPKFMADRVMALDGEALTGILQQFKLPKNQIDFAVNRLNAVQDRIQKGLEYFRDKEITASSDKYIHVLSDEAYEHVSKNKDFVNEMPVKKCLDQAIETAIQDKRQQELAKLGNSLRQDEREIRSFYQKLVEADKNVYFGSKEYAAVKKAFVAVAKERTELTSKAPTKADNEAGLSIHKPTKEEIQHLRSSYEVLTEAVNAYIKRKENQYKKSGPLDEKSSKRYEVARAISAKLNDHFLNLSNLDKHLDTIQNLYPAAAESKKRERSPHLVYDSASLERDLKRKEKEARKVTDPTAEQRMKPVMAELAFQGSLYLDNMKQTISRKEIAHKLYEAFAMAELSSVLGPNAPVSEGSRKAMLTLMQTDESKPAYADSKKQLESNLKEDFQKLHLDTFKQIREAVNATISTLEGRDKERDKKDSVQKVKEPVYLNKLIELLKNPDKIKDELPKFTQEIQKNQEAEKAVNPEETQIRQEEKSQVKTGENPQVTTEEKAQVQQKENPQIKQVEKPQVKQEKMQEDEPQTAKTRLDMLVSTLSEQCKKRRLVALGKLDKNDKEVLKRKELSHKLVEAFAMVEIGEVAGSNQVRVDRESTKLMCNALTINWEKNRDQYLGALQKIQDVIPDGDLNQMHHAQHADMRAVINMTLNDAGKLPDRLENLTNLLKQPGSVFGKMEDLAKTLDKEYKDAGIDLNRTGKPENKKKNNKPGLKA
ncbi:MAG: hypothetical protein IKQ54_01685 [Oscillospiraceae bacterium]|nr:hypothetical protein [Oscillospiraceae bacterium]